MKTNKLKILILPFILIIFSAMAFAAFCGDGSCNGVETCSNCAADCRTCGCTSHKYTACSDNDIYWYDSCNQREGIYSDCGASSLSDNFCSNNDVYKTAITKGCANNACYSTNENIKQADCGEDSYGNNFCSNNDLYRIFTDRGCSAGACFANNENQEVQDCGEDSYSSNFCLNDDVYRTFTDKGCASNACFSNNVNQTVQDCGEDSVGQPFCNNDDVYRVETERGCEQGACNTENNQVLIEDCGNNFTSSPYCSNNDVYKYFEIRGCSVGDCYFINQTNKTSECGEDSYSSNFCLNDDVYRTFTDKGCANNACFSNKVNQTVQDCGEDSSGQPFCNDDDVYRVETERGCEQGTCNTENNTVLIEDCGDGSLGGLFCLNNDVYQNLNDRTCSAGSCFGSNVTTLIEDCGNNFTSTPYCSNNDVYKYFEIRGCSVGDCYFINQTNKTSECGEDGYSSNFCLNDDVYRTFTDRGCASNACFSNRVNQTVQDCGEDTLSSDSDGGLNFFVLGVCGAGTDKGCNSGACFANPGTGNGTDSCKDSCLSTILKEFQTNGTFNCNHVLKNCNDFDNLSYDISKNACVWNDFDCGVGKCGLTDQETVDCDDYDTGFYDYFVTSTNCTMGCQNLDCCDKQRITLCGNGIIDSEEECDDGNLANGDGCSNTCQVSYQCSDSADNDQDLLIDCQDPGCHTDNDPNNEATCIPTIDDETDLSVCGNLIIESGEECDDGNLIETDGCASDCTIIDPFNYCLANLDIMYIIDRSGSTEAIYDNVTNMDILEYEKLLALKLVNLSRNDASYSGVVSFATTASLNQIFSPNLDLTYNVITNLNRLSPPPQRTNLGESIKLAGQEIEENARPSSIRLMIILADGAPNEYNDPPISCTTYPASPNDCTDYALLQANIAKQDGTQIFVLGMNPTQFSQDFFKLIANNESYYHNNPRISTIDGIYDNLVDQACGCYANNCSPEAVSLQTIDANSLSTITTLSSDANDQDSDGILDSQDNIIGDYSEIQTNLEYLTFVFESPAGVKIINPDDYDGVAHITIETYDNNKLAEFDYNFSKSTTLYLGNVTIIVNENQSEGSLVVDGLNLESQGYKKTIYLNNLNMNSKICIHDGPLQDISDITSECAGPNELIIQCPGTNGDYNCSLFGEGSVFKISGLSHTSIKQLGSYCGDGVIDAGEQCDGAALNAKTCVTQGFDSGLISCTSACQISTASCENTPAPTSSSSSSSTSRRSSGSSSSLSAVRNCSCTEWTQCSISNEQSRVCNSGSNCETQKTEYQPCTYISEENAGKETQTSDDVLENHANADTENSVYLDGGADSLTGQVIVESKVKPRFSQQLLSAVLILALFVGCYFLFIKKYEFR